MDRKQRLYETVRNKRMKDRAQIGKQIKILHMGNQTLHAPTYSMCKTDKSPSISVLILNDHLQTHPSSITVLTVPNHRHEDFKMG